MALVKFKKLIEDLENNTSLVLSSVSKVATTASYAGTVYKATTASNAGVASSAVQAGSANYAGTVAIAGTASLATSAANAGTARVAHYGSSGTGALAGTNAIYATGL